MKIYKTFKPKNIWEADNRFDLKTAMLINVLCAIFLLTPASVVKASEDVITLRVCNWEEYIDQGGWDEKERIELDNGTQIMGVNSMIVDFEKWYYENYGERVKVEYSCFGTNEDLYNQLTIGDTYDLVCPSDYMIMKLMAEKKLQDFSVSFYDEKKEDNYYIRGVSPYIREVFENNRIEGESWSKYAAGYMWGVTGILYNPEKMTDEEASTWSVFTNDRFNRQITLKDNVRDTYFAMLGILKKDQLMDKNFLSSKDYETELSKEMNDVSTGTIQEVEDLLQDVIANVYALETDSGKADIVSGKIAANYQWSGDAVYSMDQAEEDGVYLKFAVPEECTNLWFDGWVMLKNGICGDTRKQRAAEAFINFLSRPDNAVRNMYYIGYTSAVCGFDDTIFEYVNYCYQEEDNGEGLLPYPLGYFFTGDNTDEEYVVYTTQEQEGRQLFAQYPSNDIIKKAVVMDYFNNEESKKINQMWINVRCFNIKDVPAALWFAAVILIGGFCGYRIRKTVS